MIYEVCIASSISGRRSIAFSVRLYFIFCLCASSGSLPLVINLLNQPLDLASRIDRTGVGEVLEL